MNASPDLLERLAELAGCRYVSDLRFLKCRVPLGEAIRLIPVEDYPAQAWQDALYYLSEMARPHADGAECRRLLLEYCGRTEADGD